MKKTCEFCGLENSVRKGRKYCSHECSSKARSIAEVEKTCEFCGEKFMWKPKAHLPGRFCSASCGAKYNQHNGIIPSPLSERQTHARIKGVSKSPKSGPYETNVHAVEWHLISPRGKHYKFRNLKLFIRENEDLFTDEELSVFGNGKQSRAYSGLARMNPNSKRTSRQPKSWHGWRCVNPTKPQSMERSK